MWRAREDRKVGQSEQLRVVLPGTDLAKGVEPEQEDELRRLRKALPQKAQRVDRVGSAGTIELDRRGAEAGMSGDGAPNHCQAIDAARHRPALVRRARRGNEEDLIERQCFPRFFGATKMGEMDGVEGAAEDPEPRGDALRRASRRLPFGAHSRICPLPRMTYLYVVSSRRPIGPRACKRLVEMPTSAPKPNSYPSVKRVEALT